MLTLPDAYVMALLNSGEERPFSLNLACQVAAITRVAPSAGEKPPQRWEMEDTLGNPFLSLPGDDTVEAYAVDHYFKTNPAWINPAAISFTLHTGLETQIRTVADKSIYHDDLDNKAWKWMTEKGGLTPISKVGSVSLRNAVTFDPASGCIILATAAGYSLSYENSNPIAPDFRTTLLEAALADGWSLLPNGLYINPRVKTLSGYSEENLSNLRGRLT